MSNDASVIVVGAGPTGLVLANILGMHGVRTLLVEANPSTVGEPRAVSIDDESLRTMQYLGIVDAVRSRINEGYGSYYFAPSGRCFAKVLPAAEEYGFARRSAFRQPILEAQLRESLARFASVSAHFSTTVRAVSQEPERVAVTLESSAGAQRLSADYVVACDGARSSIRESLGIALSGMLVERWGLQLTAAGLAAISSLVGLAMLRSGALTSPAIAEHGVGT